MKGNGRSRCDSSLLAAVNWNIFRIIAGHSEFRALGLAQRLVLKSSLRRNSPIAR